MESLDSNVANLEERSRIHHSCIEEHQEALEGDCGILDILPIELEEEPQPPCSPSASPSSPDPKLFNAEELYGTTTVLNPPHMKNQDKPTIIRS